MANFATTKKTIFYNSNQFFSSPFWTPVAVSWTCFQRHQQSAQDRSTVKESLNDVKKDYISYFFKFLLFYKKFLSLK